MESRTKGSWVEIEHQRDARNRRSLDDDFVTQDTSRTVNFSVFWALAQTDENPNSINSKYYAHFAKSRIDPYTDFTDSTRQCYISFTNTVENPEFFGREKSMKKINTTLTASLAATLLTAGLATA